MSAPQWGRPELVLGLLSVSGWFRREGLAREIRLLTAASNRVYRDCKKAWVWDYTPRSPFASRSGTGH